MFSKEELQNLIAIVSTHPTPTGVGSQEGAVKIQLINKLSQELNALNKPEEPKVEEPKAE